MDTPRLAIRNLGKAYNVPVLRDVSLELHRGEIHGLVGENGAGKSTLINILAGLVELDSGDISLDGQRYAPASVGAAFSAGVSFAAQEPSVIETLSVAENIGLRGLPSRGGVIRRDELADAARRLLDSVGLSSIATSTPAGDLSLGERQLVEIARAICADCRVLMLDEPTAALTSQQAATVHELIRSLAAKGSAVIYVSHRLDDVLDVCDRVTVLRDGVIVSTHASTELDTASLVAEMSGGHVETVSGYSLRGGKRQPALSATGLRSRHLPHAIDLELCPGEVVGIAGLAGAGKSELLSALFGHDRRTSGQVLRHVDNGSGEIRDPGGAVRAGIGYLGEDRRTMGIFPGRSVLDNMMLPDLARHPIRIIDGRAERADGEALRDRLSIQCDSLAQDIRQLSGGNQQKVLIARWLECGAEVLMLDEPTRGVDVATKFAIHALFTKLAGDGKSLLIASSELDELMTICDRILVMSNRRMVGSFDRDEWSERDLLSAAFSAYGRRQDSTGRAGTAPA